MFAKQTNPEDETHLSVPGYICFLKTWAVYMEKLIEKYPQSNKAILEGKVQVQN